MEEQEDQDIVAINAFDFMKNATDVQREKFSKMFWKHLFDLYYSEDGKGFIDARLLRLCEYEKEEHSTGWFNWKSFSLIQYCSNDEPRTLHLHDVALRFITSLGNESQVKKRNRLLLVVNDIYAVDTKIWAAYENFQCTFIVEYMFVQSPPTLRDLCIRYAANHYLCSNLRNKIPNHIIDVIGQEQDREAEEYTKSEDRQRIFLQDLEKDCAHSRYTPMPTLIEGYYAHFTFNT